MPHRLLVPLIRCGEEPLEDFRVDRFGEVLVKAGRERPLPIGIGAVAGDGVELYFGDKPAEALGGLVTVDVGQADVEQDDVGTPIADKIERVKRMRGVLDIAMRLLEQDLERSPVVDVVVDDENALYFHAAESPRAKARRC